MRLKYDYGVISVIVDSLPGNTKNRESTRSWLIGVRLFNPWVEYNRELNQTPTHTPPGGARPFLSAHCGPICTRTLFHPQRPLPLVLITPAIFSFFARSAGRHPTHITMVEDDVLDMLVEEQDDVLADSVTADDELIWDDTDDNSHVHNKQNRCARNDQGILWRHSHARYLRCAVNSRTCTPHQCDVTEHCGACGNGGLCWHRFIVSFAQIAEALADDEHHDGMIHSYASTVTTGHTRKTTDQI